MQFARVRPKHVETLNIGSGHHRQAALRAIRQFPDLHQAIKPTMMAALLGNPFTNTFGRGFLDFNMLQAGELVKKTVGVGNLDAVQRAFKLKGQTAPDVCRVLQDRCVIC